MPCALSASGKPDDEKRDTPITRRGVPANSDARRTIRASVGPIFPPTPRTITSPGNLRIVSTTPGVGSLSAVSSCSIVWMGCIDGLLLGIRNCVWHALPQPVQDIVKHLFAPHLAEDFVQQAGVN